MDKASTASTALLRLHASDNVLVTTRIVEKGETI